MKKLFTGLTLIASILFAQQAAATLTSLDPSYQETEVGKVFAVTLSISDIPETRNLGYWEFSVSFDPDLLGFYGIGFGDPFVDSYFTTGNYYVRDYPHYASTAPPDYHSVDMRSHSDYPDPSVSYFSPEYNEFSATQAKDFILATIYFEALAEGESGLFLSPGFSIEDISTAGLGTDWESASVKIRSAPEPVSLALLGLGLAGISFARRKKY